MQKLFTLILIIVSCTTVFAEEVSDSVTFSTAQPAPSGFISWTFYWSMPEIDPDATLEYVVLQPNGEEYYRLTIPGTIISDQVMRSDFSVDFAGGNPEVFYGHNIFFTFTVDKGTIEFSDDAWFLFEFTEIIDAVR